MAAFSSLFPQTRVSQLDAVVLDQELYDLLLNQVLALFSQYNQSFKARYINEIELLLKSLIFKYTLWDNSNTYGFFLQNLKLVNSRSLQKISKRVKALYYAVFILGDYLFKHFNSYLFSIDKDDLQDELDELLCAQSNGQTKSWRKFQIISELYLVQYIKPVIVHITSYLQMFKLLNFVRFLIDGKFNSLKFYMLNIGTKVNSVEMEQMSKGNVNYEFQHRQIIWNTLIEFVVFLLPLVSKFGILKKYRRKGRKYLSLEYLKKIKLINYLQYYFNGSLFLDRPINEQDEDSPHLSDNDIKQNGAPSSSSKSKIGKYHHLPTSQCAICYERNNDANNATATSSSAVTQNNTSNYNNNNNNNNNNNFTGSNLISNPYVTNCGHVYCYLCILEKLEKHSTGMKSIAEVKKLQQKLENSQNENDDDDHWNCLRCSDVVLWCKPYDDIDESAIIVAGESDSVNNDHTNNSNDVSNENDRSDDNYDDGDVGESYQNITQSQLGNSAEFAEFTEGRRRTNNSGSSSSSSSSSSYDSVEEEPHDQGDDEVEVEDEDEDEDEDYGSTADGEEYDDGDADDDENDFEESFEL